MNPTSPLLTLVTPWPRTIKEAVDRLHRLLSDEDLGKLRAMSPDDVRQFHSSLGMVIRNEFGLWKGNTELLKACGSATMHPDDASMVILMAMMEKLKKR